MKSKDRLTSTQALSREKPSSQRRYPVHSIYFLIWYSTASQKTKRIASDACLKEKLKRKRNLYQKEETKVCGLAQKERFCFKLHQKRKMASWHPKSEESFGIPDLGYPNEWHTKSHIWQSPITKPLCKREESPCERQGIYKTTSSGRVLVPGSETQGSKIWMDIVFQKWPEWKHWNRDQRKSWSLRSRPKYTRKQRHNLELMPGRTEGNLSTL